MRRLLIAMCVAFLGISPGCASEPSSTAASETNAQPMAEPMADVTADDVGADIFSSSIAYANPANPEVAANGVSRLVTIGQGASNFSVIFGGCDENKLDTGEGKGRVVTNADPMCSVQQTLSSSATDPAWIVESGYALAWGWRPFVTTPEVVTGSDGTTVLVQIDTVTGVHRVVLINGGPTEVHVKPGTAPRCDAPSDNAVMIESELLIDPMTFVECSSQNYPGGVCYTLSQIKKLSDPGNRELRRFVREALKARRTRTLAQEP